MPNTTKPRFPAIVRPAPTTVPLPPDVRVCRRFGLSAATGRLIAELAFQRSAA